MTRVVTRKARGKRMYGLIEWGKRIGIHRLAFGSPGVAEVAKPTDAELRLLTSLLADEQRSLDGLRRQAAQGAAA